MFDTSTTIDFPLSSATSMNFDDLVERHKSMVFRTAWRMLGTVADAEDVVQEVFLRVHGLKEEPATGWIYRVTVNYCLDQIRKRKPAADVEVLDFVAVRDPSPEAALDLKQKQERLALLIARLPERERACLVLRDLEGLNSREVGAILDCTEETVRSSIFRAKEKLKQWMS